MNIDVLTFYETIRNYLVLYLKDQKNYSQHTIRSYRTTITLLIEYVCLRQEIKMKQVHFDLFNAPIIIDFLTFLETDKKNSIATRNLRLTILKAFFYYVAQRDIMVMKQYLLISDIPLKKDKKKQVEHLSEEEFKFLLEQINTRNIKGLRNQCFLILMYDTAAREDEMLNIQIKDIVLKEKGSFMYLHGKGNKTRMVPIMDSTKSHLENYFRIYHKTMNTEDYLFYIITHGIKHKMSSDCAYKFVKKYGQLASEKNSDFLPNLYPHHIRHSRAIHLYRNGMPLPIVSEFLGHAQIETTLVYAYADTEMKRAAIDKAMNETEITNDEVIVNWSDDEETLKILYGLK